MRSPYRDPALPDAAPPRFADGRRLIALFAALLIALGVWLAVLMSREHTHAAAVLALPPPVREASLDHTLDELTTTCAREPRRLADHCASLARHALSFPACDVACQATARAFLDQATR